jgi:uridylate kinase
MPTKSQRILCKLSGEILSGDKAFGIDPKALETLTDQLTQIDRKNNQIAIVLGAGNLFRGGKKKLSIDRVYQDQMGMHATVMNAIALKGSLINKGVSVKAFCSFGGMLPRPSMEEAIKALESESIVIFSGGTGHPFVTTDTAAALKAAEIRAHRVVKVTTHVDGVYNKDPITSKDAIKYGEISFLHVLQNEIQVMDMAAVAICKERNIPITVCNYFQENLWQKICQNVSLGTSIK